MIKKHKETTMSTISISLPPIEAEDSVEVEVKINGQKRKYSYRVEVFKWSAYCKPVEHKVECLRRMVEGYDRHWQLMEIGSPTENEVPVTFRRVG
jgi:hypothetical protein